MGLFSRPKSLPNLDVYMQMNANVNKFEVARQKILKYHFSGGNSTVEEFVGMEMKVLPRATSWIGRDVGGFALLYQVIRSMPSLFDCDVTAKTSSKTRKRTCLKNV